jgi:hypothetical protein
MFMYRYLLALHVPFVLKASTDPTLYCSRKVNLEVALSLLDHPTGPDEDDYVRVMIIGSGVMSRSLNLTILVVSAELLDMLENEMSALTLISSAMNRQPLRKILDENIELISRRISQGQPDIEVSMLFAGLTAQIHAAQAGQPADDAIIDAFHRCLSENFNTLKTCMLDHQVLDPTLESTTRCFDLLNTAWHILTHWPCIRECRCRTWETDSRTSPRPPKRRSRSKLPGELVTMGCKPDLRRRSISWVTGRFHTG